MTGTVLRRPKDPVQFQMMQDLAFDTEPGAEKWVNFDPPYPRKTAAPLERRDFIETRGLGRDAEHRLTATGWMAHFAWQERF